METLLKEYVDIVSRVCGRAKIRVKITTAVLK